MARGSVYKRGKSWCIRFDVGIDDVTGKRQQGSKGGFMTRGEAEHALAQVVHEVAVGKHVPAKKLTLGEFATEWIETMVKGTVRASTYARYLGVIKVIIAVLGQIILQDLRPRQVLGFYRELERRKNRPATIRKAHKTLKQMIKAAVALGMVVRNIVDDVKPPSDPQTEMKAWDATQLARFLDSTAGIPFYGPLWHLIGKTGMRRGEALGLRWTDIDWEQGRIGIQQQVISVDSQVTIGPLKTRSSYRVVSVANRTLAILRAHQDAQNAIKLGAGDTWHDHGLVFCRQSGDNRGYPTDPNAITHAWTVGMRKCDLVPTIRLHDLRHTHVSIMLRAGVNLRVVAARIGDNPATMLRTYAHAIPADQDAAVEQFERALSACVSEPADAERVI